MPLDAWRRHGQGVIRTVATAAVLVLLPVAGSAQRVVSTHSSRLFQPPVTQSYDLATERLEWTEPGGIYDRRPVFTSDGRYLLSVRQTATSAATLQLKDVLSNATVILPFDFSPLIAHPRRLAIFGLSGGSAARLDEAGLHLSTSCAPATAQALDLTIDGTLLLALCASGDLVVMNADTGAIVRTVPMGAGPMTHMTARGDGSQVVVIRQGPSQEPEFALVDTVTGMTIATTLFPPLPQPVATPCVAQLGGVSPDRHTVVATCRWFLQSPFLGLTTFLYRTRLLALDTLTWGRELAVPFSPVGVAIGPDNGTALVASSDPLRFGGAIQAIYVASGLATFTVGGFPYAFAAAFAPLAPALSVDVTDGRAALRWTLPAHSPAATGHVLEAGTAPGLSNLGTLSLGPAGTLSVPAVPPGMYFVRVRAQNATGVGAASNEVVVTVP